eukprot:3910830-Amphidinium_carterae.1
MGGVVPALTLKLQQQPKLTDSLGLVQSGGKKFDVGWYKLSETTLPTLGSTLSGGGTFHNHVIVWI